MSVPAPTVPYVMQSDPEKNPQFMRRWLGRRPNIRLRGEMNSRERRKERRAAERAARDLVERQ